MKAFSGLKKYEVVAALIALLCIILGIGLWATFWPVFLAITKNVLKLEANHDGSLKYAAFMFTNPPMKNVMKYVFFNVTNPDEITYYGAKPQLIETGGYGFIESEQKKYLEFSDDKTKMFYQNYKKYLYSPENSDPGLSYEDNIVFPNPPGTGAVATIFGAGINYSPTVKTIIGLGLLLVGEYPMISKKIEDVLFEGYNDPLLDIAHSSMFNIISNVFFPGNDILTNVVPPMKFFSYMDGYNNSYDENYWVNTGTNDVDKVGEVESWAGLTELPEAFWPTPEARRISGSDSGSFTKMHLKESDELPFFFSFMCRSFKKTFDKKTIVSGIKAMKFSIPPEDFDTTLEKNKGFRYKNLEKVDYYPEWPGCPDTFCNNCKSESCRLCCGRNVVNGTYLLPPGMFPLVCYPGHNKQPPFTIIVSPPHFLYSPEAVQNSVSGMKPDREKHVPMSFDHEKVSGTVLQVDARYQVNLPVVNNKNTMYIFLRIISEANFSPNFLLIKMLLLYRLTSQLPNVIIPLFYETAHATLADMIYDKIRMGFVIVPRIIEYLKFLLIFLGVCIIAVLLVIRLQYTSKTLPLRI